MNSLKPLTVAVAQPLSILGEFAANIAAHVEVTLASQARVVVFPELSLTAYDHAVMPIPLNLPELQLLKEAALKSNSVLLVGAPIKIDHHRFIAFVRVDATDLTIVYRKTCLTPDEHRVFTQGSGPAAIEVDGWRIGLAICKDTWNSEYMKGYGKLDLDLIIAGVVDGQDEEASAHEVRALMARRLRVPMAVARTAGRGPVFHRSSGRSVIYDHTGTVLAQAGVQPGEFARATLIPQR